MRPRTGGLVRSQQRLARQSALAELKINRKNAACRREASATASTSVSASTSASPSAPDSVYGPLPFSAANLAPLKPSSRYKTLKKALANQLLSRNGLENQLAVLNDHLTTAAKGNLAVVPVGSEDVASLPSSQTSAYIRDRFSSLSFASRIS